MVAWHKFAFNECLVNAIGHAGSYSYPIAFVPGWLRSFIPL